MCAARFRQQARKAQAIPDITIGIDFGTSTTKVMFRERDSDESLIVGAPDSGEDLWPSTAVVAGDSIRFGTGAAAGGVVLRWLKMELADSERCHHAPEVRGRASEMTWECPATLFLAWVIREATAIVRAHVGDCNLTYNMAVPVADLATNVEVRARFERCLFYANELASCATREWGVDEAIDSYVKVVESHPSTPSEAGRRTFVVPETHAAVAGLFFSRSLEDGHHAVIDIGAGTTDISVLLFRQSVQVVDGYPGQITYLGAGTAPVACNDADRAIAERLLGKVSSRPGPSRMARVQEAVRAAKVEWSDGPLRLEDWGKLTKREVYTAVRGVCDRIFDLYRKTWYLGYEKEMRPRNWQVLQVLLLGGGSQFTPFTVRFREKPFPIEMSIEQSWIDFPEGLQMLTGGKVKWVEDRDFLFTIADGLSYHYAKMARAWLPPDVDPFGPLDLSSYEPLMRNDDD